MEMDTHGLSMEEIFKALEGSELQREEFHEETTWDEYVRAAESLKKDDPVLKVILQIRENEEVVRKTQLNDIMSMTYDKAKKVIDAMTIAKRIEVLEELDAYKNHLYKSVGTWGAEGIPKEEQLSADSFRTLLGRIKHLEILQGWLFGIV